VHNANQASPCECDPTGSVSSVCDWAGGACQCRPNVDGKRCNICAVGSYGFGPTGCKLCNCINGGSLKAMCNKETGQCDCFENVVGRQCESCAHNFWLYPFCRPCKCNGFADSCDQELGECIDCKHHTYGKNCEK